MPTIRPRHQVTETPEVAHALNLASQQWPQEPRSKLLVRLVQIGRAALERERGEAGRARFAAVERSSGKYADSFGENFLSELRQEWPE